jgi:hypothetical protein
MVILPIVPIVYEAWKGNVDLDVSRRESRTKFFIFSMMCDVLAFSIYSLLGCLIMSTLAAAYFSVTLGITIVSLRWKISVHAAGVGGPGMALIYVYGVLALLVVLVWAIVVWSRVTLKQHSVEQSLAGILLSVGITIITYLILYHP